MSCPQGQCQDKALEELATLGFCFSAIADLLNPETDLASVDRDNLALLMRYLAHRQALVLGVAETNPAGE